MHPQGEIPSPINLPAGCRFAGRCPRVTQRCRAENPQLYECAPGRRVACFYPLEPGRA